MKLLNKFPNSKYVVKYSKLVVAAGLVVLVLFMGFGDLNGYTHFSLSVARAQTNSIVPVNLPNSIPMWNDDINSVVGYFASFLLVVLGAFAFFGVVYGGIMMITSAGDASKFSAGRKNVIWSATGIALVALSYAIITFASRFGFGLIH